MTKLASLSSLFLVSATLAALSGTTPAKADARGAFCLQNYGTVGSDYCYYYTLAQCRAAASGLSGSCIANPYSASPHSAFAFQRRGVR